MQCGPSSTGATGFAKDAALAWDQLSGAAGSLSTSGQTWAVVDGVLGSRLATALLKEAEALEQASLLTPHALKYTDQEGHKQVFEHPGRRHVELDPTRVEARTAEVAPLLVKFFAEQEVAHLVSQLERTLPGLNLSKAPHVRLQITHGEYGCTPCHHDISSSTPSNLQLSILIYLSEGWCQDWGGELQLQPFIGLPVAVEPSFDRAVLFSSASTLHRSLPPQGRGVNRARWLLTIWLEGMEAADALSAKPGTLAPALQHLLSPALHASAYLEAIRQSLPPGKVRTALMIQQQAEITGIESDEELTGLLEGLRELQDEKEEEESTLHFLNGRPAEADECDDMDAFLAACEPLAKQPRLTYTLGLS